MSQSEIVEKSFHHKRASFKEKLAWSAGGVTEMMNNSIGNLATPIYSIALGVDPALIGVATAIPRIVDAFTDPLMGSISDNTRSRWGRRRPYILVGSFLLLLSFPLMWLIPSGWGENSLFVYFMLTSILFFLCMTVWNITWTALGFELTDDYNDRTSLQIMRSVFVNLATVSLGWLYPLCFVFSDSEAIGVRYVGLIIGVVMFACGVLPALMCRERKLTTIQKTKVPLGQSIKITLKNRPFLLLAGALTTFACGSILVQPLLMYTNIYYVFSGDKASAGIVIGVAGTASLVTTLMILPLGNMASKKIGKRRTALFALIMLLIGKGSYWFTLNPDMPYLQVISRCLFQPFMALLWALVPAMIADVCDLDELETGHRREAAFGAAYQWLWKFGSTAAVALSGILLSLIGAKGEAGLTSLPVEVVVRLKLLFCTVPPAFAAVAFIFMYFYPLTHKRVEEIKAQLDEQSSLQISC